MAACARQAEARLWKPMESVSGDYDFVVVGCGGIGSGTLYWLSRKAGGQKRILGLEQFELGHSRGGSQDYSRIVRRMYHVEAYTKLAAASLDAWREVEKEAKHQLVVYCGGVIVNEKGDPFLKDVVDAAKKFKLRYEHLSGSELHKRYPQFAVDDNFEAVVDKDAGLVDAAQANAVHVALARQHGATVVDNCKVISARKLPSGQYEVVTSRGKVTCKKLIITAGAWSNQILGNFGVHVPLTVTQEQVQYYATPYIQDFLPHRFPIWIMNWDNISWYGMPIHGIMGVKAAMDSMGASVTAGTRSFTPNPDNTARTDAFVKKFFPKSYGPKALVKTCLYTMPPDRHFVVDTLKGYGHSNVIACIGAGHAFKFSSVLGRNLAEMALDRPPVDIDTKFFSLYRQALTDPTYPDQCRQFGIKPVTEPKSKL